MSSSKISLQHHFSLNLVENTIKTNFTNISRGRKNKRKYVIYGIYMFLITFIIMRFMHLTNICRTLYIHRGLQVKAKVIISPRIILFEPNRKELFYSDVLSGEYIDNSIKNDYFLYTLGVGVERVEYPLDAAFYSNLDSLSSSKNSENRPYYNSIKSSQLSNNVIEVITRSYCRIKLNNHAKVLYVTKLPSALSVLIHFYEATQAIREKLLQSFLYWLPRGQSLLAFGVLFGQIDRFPQELHEYFINSGVIHVVAASGYNVTVVIVMIQRLLKKFNFIRVVFLLTLAGIIIYCMLAGASPSVLRAGIMGGLAIVAKSMGRPSPALVLLAVTTLCMLLISPLLIVNLSFLLSVSATVGLVLFGPEQTVAYKSKPSTVLCQIKLTLKESLLTSLAASAFTLPLIVVIFKRLSIISFISNTVLLWCVPLIMIVSVIYLVAQYIHPWIGLLLAFPLWAITTTFLRVVKVFATLPFASVEWETPHWSIIPVSYTCLILLFLYKNRLKRLKV